MLYHHTTAPRLGPRHVDLHCGLWPIEQRQVDGVAHLAIPEIAQVQPVAAIVDWQHLGRMLGVAQRLVEIDDAVKTAAGADQLLTATRCPSHRVPGAGEERLVAERRQGGAKQFDAACLGRTAIW